MTAALGTARGLFEAVGAAFVTKIVAAVLSLLTSVFVARALGPDGRGVFAAAATLAAVGVQLGTVGLHAGNPYFLARDQQLLAPIVGNSIWVGGAAGVVAALALALVMFVTGGAATIGALPMAVSLAGVPLSIVFALLVGLLLPLGAVRRYNELELALRVVMLAMSFAVLLTGTVNPAYYLLAGVVTSAIALGAAWWSLPSTAQSVPRVSMPLVREHIPYGFRAYLGGLFCFLLLRVDQLMVQQLSGNAEAGHYSIAVAMADILSMLPSVAGAIIFPKLAAATSDAERRRMTLQTAAALAASMTALGLVAAVVAGPFVSLTFGQAFYPAVNIFYVLIPAVIVLGINTILSNHMAADGMPWRAVWVWVFGLAVNVLLNFVWIPRYGGAGAAMASLVAYAGVFCVQAVWVLRGR